MVVCAAVATHYELTACKQLLAKAKNSAETSLATEFVDRFLCFFFVHSRLPVSCFRYRACWLAHLHLSSAFYFSIQPIRFRSLFMCFVLSLSPPPSLSISLDLASPVRRRTDKRLVTPINENDQNVPMPRQLRPSSAEDRRKMPNKGPTHFQLTLSQSIDTQLIKSKSSRWLPDRISAFNRRGSFKLAYRLINVNIIVIDRNCVAAVR